MDETVALLECLVKSIPGAVFDRVVPNMLSLGVSVAYFRLNGEYYRMAADTSGRLLVMVKRRWWRFDLGDPDLLGKLAPSVVGDCSSEFPLL